MPRLSHQFPVVVEVAAVVAGVETEVGDVGATTVVDVVDTGALVVVEVGVEVAVVVEVDEEQDAKTVDITIRQVRAIPIAPLFI
jgi:predicted RNA-binding protein (virulence factor B family)